jgi:hypothetical protein
MKFHITPWELWFWRCSILWFWYYLFCVKL